MSDTAVFLAGIFVSVVFTAGVVFSLMEFRNMERDPERYERDPRLAPD